MAMGRGMMNQLVRKWEGREAKEREARKAEIARAQRYEAKLEAEVEQEMLAELAEREAEALVSPTEKMERRLAQLESGPSAIPAKGPSHPKGWAIARENVAARWKREAQEQREQRESDLGITKAREVWESRSSGILAARDESIREARERCLVTQQAARERCDKQLAELGDRPALNEAVPV